MVVIQGNSYLYVAVGTSQLKLVEENSKLDDEKPRQPEGHCDDERMEDPVKCFMESDYEVEYEQATNKEAKEVVSPDFDFDLDCMRVKN